MTLLYLASESDPAPPLAPAIVKSLRDDDGPTWGVCFSASSNRIH
jgi:hypothetical protein